MSLLEYFCHSQVIKALTHQHGLLLEHKQEFDEDGLVQR